MKQVVIENPVINSPFREPDRHFRFTDEGITNEVIDGRRSSSYFVPIARPRKKGQKQLEFDTEWTQDRIEDVLVGYRTAVVIRFDPKGCKMPVRRPVELLLALYRHRLCHRPMLREPVKDPTRFSWHEVSKVQHYWLEANAMTKPTMVRDDLPKYGKGESSE